jgi:hypothetical protein
MFLDLFPTNGKPQVEPQVNLLVDHIMMRS